jgi:hypothetical protein
LNFKRTRNIIHEQLSPPEKCLNILCHRVLSRVVPEGKLIAVSTDVSPADVVIHAHEPSREHGPVVFDRVGVAVSAHILLCLVVDRLVAVVQVHVPVATPRVRVDGGGQGRDIRFDDWV